MSTVKIAVLSAVLVVFSFIAGCSSDNDNTKSTEKEALIVYKSPTCGCCKAWVKHVNDAGVATTVSYDSDMLSVKKRFGIKPEHRSCHTAVSKEGYVFEGHIPAKAIQSFLSKKPVDAIGLAVPGMPMGSPGMEQNDSFTPYQVVQLMKDGSVVPYMAVNNQKDQYK